MHKRSLIKLFTQANSSPVSHPVAQLTEGQRGHSPSPRQAECKNRDLHHCSH